mmetsp:Transcript_32149/g.83311  ORF Transcript_32149/g.83311 Transcript_32149/m.83311 type:complete len:211 (+) Transcript_32149:348-980(+)
MSVSGWGAAAPSLPSSRSTGGGAVCERFHTDSSMSSEPVAITSFCTGHHSVRMIALPCALMALMATPASLPCCSLRLSQILSTPSAHAVASMLVSSAHQSTQWMSFLPCALLTAADALLVLRSHSISCWSSPTLASISALPGCQHTSSIVSPWPVRWWRAPSVVLAPGLVPWLPASEVTWSFRFQMTTFRSRPPLATSGSTLLQPSANSA